MKKYVVLALLFTPILFFVCWISILSTQVVEGQEVRVAITGYDPRSLLSGHYIRYQVDWDKTDVEERGVVSTLYNTQFYASERCDWNNGNKINCRWIWLVGNGGFTGRNERFYIPEENADKLDSLFRSNKHQFEIIYACAKGRTPIAKQLLIDGQDWRNFIKEN